MQTEIRGSEGRSMLSAGMRYWLPAATATLLLWNCLAASPQAGPANRRLPVETLWAGSQCGCKAPGPMVRWLTNQDQLTAAAATTGSTTLELQVTRRPVDWAHRGIVWIDMGLKPSGGYALSLAESSAVVSEGVATITVRWRQPGPGSVVTQQLTSPCLLVTLARDNFRTIQIRDEAGATLTGLELDGE